MKVETKKNQLRLELFGSEKNYCILLSNFMSEKIKRIKSAAHYTYTVNTISVTPEHFKVTDLSVFNYCFFSSNKTAHSYCLIIFTFYYNIICTVYIHTIVSSVVKIVQHITPDGNDDGGNKVQVWIRYICECVNYVLLDLTAKKINV